MSLDLSALEIKAELVPHEGMVEVQKEVLLEMIRQLRAAPARMAACMERGFDIADSYASVDDTGFYQEHWVVDLSEARKELEKAMREPMDPL